MDLTVVLPARNEADNLPGVIRETLDAMEGAGIDGEVLAIDDGSTDDTYAVTRSLAGPRVRLLRFPQNRGRAHAIAEGFALADGWAVAVMDSDDQYDPGDLAALLRALRAGADVANGVRVDRADDVWRRVVSSTYNLVLMRGMLGLRTRDANSGLKAFRAAALPVMGYDPDGFRRGHRYLVAWAEKRGLHVVEVPIRHRPRTAGSSYIRPLREARNTLLDMIAFRRAIRRGGEEPAAVAREA
ncbi:MAG: glycosyltransferase family 2 protein [Thermoleophilia bacterium]